MFSLEMCPEYLKDQLSSRITCKLICLKEATEYSVVNAIEGKKDSGELEQGETVDAIMGPVSVLCYPNLNTVFDRLGWSPSKAFSSLSRTRIG